MKKETTVNQELDGFAFDVLTRSETILNLVRILSDYFVFKNPDELWLMQNYEYAATLASVLLDYCLLENRKMDELYETLARKEREAAK